MQRTTAIGLLVCFGGLFSLSGCSKSMPSELGAIIPVEGKVTLAGKPLKGGNVTFYPLEHDVNICQPQGVIDSEGNYFVTSYEKKGAPAGQYRVTIDPGGEDKAQDRLIHPDYLHRDHSPLTVTIQENAPAGTYDLKLELLPKKR